MKAPGEVSLLQQRWVLRCSLAAEIRGVSRVVLPKFFCQRDWFRGWLPVLLVYSFLSCLPAVMGAGIPAGVLAGIQAIPEQGAGQDSEPSAEELGESKAARPATKLEDFESRPVVLFPGQFSDEAKNNRYKLGHWAVANFRVQANAADSTGQLHAYLVDTLGQPVPIPGTRFVADSTRPFTLPRGQEKNLEALVFLPQRTAEAAAANVHVDLTSPAGLRLVDTIQPVLLLKPHQYHLVALVRNNEEYRYLRLLDCIQLPRSSSANAPPFYSLVYPSPEQPIPLATSALAWTTIAYLIWDQILPEELSAEQQQALLDWLHFGGQLIISGPNSLEKLRGSFLEPFLPVKLSGNRNLAADDFGDFNRTWAPPKAKDPEQRRELTIPATAPMLGVSWDLVERGSELPGGKGLVAERAVGRGRIVVTAFPLSEKRLQTWPGFAGFFNGALLRRPSRAFFINEFSEIGFYWREDSASIYDPLLGSALRLAARDLPTAGLMNGGSQWSPPVEDLPPDLANPPPGQIPGEFPRQAMVAAAVERNMSRDPWHYGGFEADPQGGVAAWNDEVGIAAAARESIALAAGISPPSPEFVLRMLGLYLLCLVPLNWLLFRLVGRVEWAWFAAPLIAIGGAIIVVRLAALDIGFVRSQSQLGLLEIPVAYERGHLAEYSALYTSLSTRYQVEFADQTGIALPFPPRSEPVDSPSQQTTSPVYLERTLNNRLREFLVQSNSTGMLHGENLLDLGGRLELVTEASVNDPELSNGTALDLQGVGVVERTTEGSVRVAWLGDLAAGAKRRLEFRDVPEAEIYRAWKELPEYQSLEQRCRALWEQAFGLVDSVRLEMVMALPEFQPVTNQAWQYFRRSFPNDSVNRMTPITFLQFKLAYARLVFAAERKELGLGEMFDALTDCLRLAPGEMRLIARSSAVIGEHRLQPAATRVTRSTLILAHLRPPPLPPVSADENTLLDLLDKNQLDWMQEDASGEDGEEVDSGSDK